MVLGVGRGDELETQQVAVRPGLGPNDPRVLDRRMVGRRPHPQRADVIEGHTHVDRNPQAAHARIDRQAGASRRREELDLGIERPAPKPTTRTTVHGQVDAALR